MHIRCSHDQVWRRVLGFTISANTILTVSGDGQPSGYYRLDASLQLHDAQLGGFVKGKCRNVQGTGQAGQAVRLILIIERVKNLDCTRRL
jgi:hypothetical protein